MYPALPVRAQGGDWALGKAYDAWFISQTHGAKLLPLHILHLLNGDNVSI